MATLKGEEKKKFLYDRLAEVRHNLSKSLGEICAGDLHEGIRIATAVRVLVHETGRQKPLLKQLTPNYLELQILDEPPREKEQLPPGVQSVTVMSVPIGFKISKEGVFLDSSLHSHAPTILGRWWTRPSLIIPGGTALNRRDVILGLADKEGGTHVDPEIPKPYLQLMNYHSLQIGVGNDVAPLDLARLMAGQAGLELLDCLDRNFPEPQARPAASSH